MRSERMRLWPMAARMHTSLPVPTRVSFYLVQNQL
jgi:hypothetical protein